MSNANYLNQFVRVFIESSSDGNPLFFLHRDILLKVPTLDNLDGGKDHVLTHAQMLLLPQGDHSIVVSLQLLSCVNGLLLVGNQRNY